MARFFYFVLSLYSKVSLKSYCREVTRSHFEKNLETCPSGLSEALIKDRIRGESLELSLEDEPPKETDEGRSDM